MVIDVARTPRGQLRSRASQACAVATLSPSMDPWCTTMVMGADSHPKTRARIRRVGVGQPALPPPRARVERRDVSLRIQTFRWATGDTRRPIRCGSTLRSGLLCTVPGDFRGRSALGGTGRHLPGPDGAADGACNGKHNQEFVHHVPSPAEDDEWNRHSTRRYSTHRGA